MFGNGPLVTVRSLPEKATRAPLRLSLTPPASTNSPASISAWLNAPMSAKSLAGGMPPASESSVALTITMTRIALSPVGLSWAGASTRFAWSGWYTTSAVELIADSDARVCGRKRLRRPGVNEKGTAADLGWPPAHIGQTGAYVLLSWPTINFLKREGQREPQGIVGGSMSFCGVSG